MRHLVRTVHLNQSTNGNSTALRVSKRTTYLWNVPLSRLFAALCLISLLLSAGPSPLAAGLLTNSPPAVALDEAISGPITVHTRYTFPADSAGEQFAGVWLGGLADAPGMPPRALAVTWTEQGTGWFPGWGIQLLSDRDLLNGDLRVNRGAGVLGGAEYLNLSATESPQWGHTYESLLSYNPNSGALSISIYDLTADRLTYEGQFVISSVNDTLYPVAGTTDRSDAFHVIEDVQAYATFIPRSVDWELMRLRDGSFTTVSLTRLARNMTDAGIRLRVPEAVPGEFRLHAEQNSIGVPLLTAKAADEEFIPLSLEPLFAGESHLVLEYVLDDTVLFRESKQVNTGQVSIAIHPDLELHADGPGDPVLVGHLDVTADGTLPPFMIGIGYELRTPGTASPLHTQWHTRYGRFKIPADLTTGQDVSLPFEIPVQLSTAEVQDREIFVTLHLNIESEHNLELTQTGRHQLVYGERTSPFPKVGDYHVLRGDFHIHTTLSDGDLEPIDRTWESYMYGYDVIALTDHRWTTSGYDISIDFANEIGLLMIRGFETGIDEREHFIVLDISTDYVLRDEHHWALEPGTDRIYYQDKVRDIIAHGGFIHYAHPGSIYIAPPTYKHPDREYGWTEEVAWMIENGYLHGVEIKANYEAPRRDAAFRWAIEHGLTLIETSDVHRPRDFNNAYSAPTTLVLVEDGTADSVMDALRAGRTLIWRLGQLRGTETWLAPFLEAALDVEMAFENDTPCVRITNKTGLPLHGLAEVGTQGNQRVHLPAHGSVCLDTLGEATTVSVRWTNIWSSPETLFQSEHTIEYK